MAGLPEVAPGGDGPGLLVEGIYGRIRHPRYIELTLGTLGWALFANYLAGYAIVAFNLVTSR